MKEQRVISEKRQRQIDEKIASDITVGESVLVKVKHFHEYFSAGRGENIIDVKVMEIKPEGWLVLQEDTGSLRKTTKSVHQSLIAGRETLNVGANPFNLQADHCRTSAFTLQSILYTLNIFGEKDETLEKYTIGGEIVKGLNWNPFVFDKDGKKVRYQRGFVWNVEDKQLLVESIYNGMDCGRILIRERSWSELEALAKKGEKELYWKDIVDGKQRLDAVRGFIMGEFPDLHGNYWGDLSHNAQRKFTDHQYFSYAALPEGSKDEDVIYQFLRVNFSGVQMSKEHLDWVKSINI